MKCLVTRHNDLASIPRYNGQQSGYNDQLAGYNAKLVSIISNGQLPTMQLSGSMISELVSNDQLLPATYIMTNNFVIMTA